METRTERDKPILVHDGYEYRFDRRSADDGKFWRCLLDGCKGRIKTDASDVFIEYRNATHAHSVYADPVKTEQTITTMTDQAEQEMVSVGQICCQGMAALSSQLATERVMPTFQGVNCMLFLEGIIQAADRGFKL